MILVHLFVYFAHVDFCPFSLPLSVGLAAACDFGIPWPFLLTCFHIYNKVKSKSNNFVGQNNTVFLVLKNTVEVREEHYN